MMRLSSHRLVNHLGLSCLVLSSGVSALQPLNDEQLADVVGQSGLSINVETRIQAGEIRYSQHNNDGSERGSISLKNFDLFGAGTFDGDTPNEVFSPIELLDLVVESPENRSFAEIGLPNGVVIGTGFLVNSLQQAGVGFQAIDRNGVIVPLEEARPLEGALLLDPVTGEGLTSVTATVDVDDGQLRIVLPRLTRIQEVLLGALDSLENPVIGSSFVSTIIASSIAAIPFGLEFELAINDRSLGRVLIKNFTDVDTELRISGRSDGTSGVRIDLDLGLGFESVSYFDTDEDGGELSLEGFRIGQVADPRDIDFSSRPGIGFRFARGAPLLGLTLDAEQRSLLDLTTGEVREATALVVGLPEIQNLDLTIDNIRIGDGNLGGLDILDINTLVGNDTVQQLNQTFGRNFALGNDAGVDALGQAATGYQLKGELLLSGTADNSLQFNGQWGGQIGSIRYYDALELVEVPGSGFSVDDPPNRFTSNNEQNISFNDISIYAEDTDAQGNSILTPAQFEGTLTLTPQGVELGNLNARGSIAIQSVTIGQSNLGAFLIDNFQLRDSQITISGRP